MVPISYLAHAQIPQTTSANIALCKCMEHILMTKLYQLSSKYLNAIKYSIHTFACRAMTVHRYMAHMNYSKGYMALGAAMSGL